MTRPNFQRKNSLTPRQFLVMWLILLALSMGVWYLVGLAFVSIASAIMLSLPKI